MDELSCCLIVAGVSIICVLAMGALAHVVVSRATRERNQ